MTDQHPKITLPAELVALMIMQTFGPLGPTGLADEVELAKAFASFAAMAAEWGYQKHEEKPSTQAEKALNHFESFSATFDVSGGDSDLIRRALERLKQLEDSND